MIQAVLSGVVSLRNTRRSAETFGFQVDSAGTFAGEEVHQMVRVLAFGSLAHRAHRLREGDAVVIFGTLSARAHGDRVGLSLRANTIDLVTASDLLDEED